MLYEFCDGCGKAEILCAQKDDQLDRLDMYPAISHSIRRDTLRKAGTFRDGNGELPAAPVLRTWCTLTLETLIQAYSGNHFVMRNAVTYWHLQFRSGGTLF